MCSGRVIAEPTTTAKAPAAIAARACSGIADAALGDDGPAAAGEGGDERQVRVVRNRAAHVAGQRGADEVDAKRDGGVALGGGRDVGHCLSGPWRRIAAKRSATGSGWG